MTEQNHKKDNHAPEQPKKEHEAAHGHDKEKKAKTNEEILVEKNKELHDKYLRSLAELDNFRKRVAKDKEDFVKYTRSDVLQEVLPVLDNLERAMLAAAKTKDYEGLKAGIDMVIKQFGDTLKKLGASEIETKGVFNPELHHVMHKEHVDGKEEGEILEVYQKGYQMDGKLIRPAMVKVAVKEEKK